MVYNNIEERGTVSVQVVIYGLRCIMVLKPTANMSGAALLKEATSVNKTMVKFEELATGYARKLYAVGHWSVDGELIKYDTANCNLSEPYVKYGAIEAITLQGLYSIGAPCLVPMQRLFKRLTAKLLLVMLPSNQESPMVDADIKLNTSKNFFINNGDYVTIGRFVESARTSR